MTPLAQAQHFVRAPDWTWYIVPYFFLAGLAGGSYVIATLLRLWGDRRDEPAARLGYYAFLAFLPCPILLTLDLTQPLRFWHMLWNTTPGNAGPNFKSWSPMSVGSWALVTFGLFATVSFLEALARDRGWEARWLRPLDGALGRAWIVVGAVLGLFIAGYTGVLLAVSNQPVWSDTWALGGLFLASGLAGSAALLALLVRRRPAARASGGMLELSERLWSLLELALLVVFALTLVPDGTLDDAFGFPWILLWLVAFAGLLPGLARLVTARLAVTSEGAVVAQPAVASAVTYWLVLLGVLALRAADPQRPAVTLVRRSALFKTTARVLPRPPNACRADPPPQPVSPRARRSGTAERAWTAPERSTSGLWRSAATRSWATTIQTWPRSARDSVVCSKRFKSRLRRPASPL